MEKNLDLISRAQDFSKWQTINDTIMGGSSKAVCKVVQEGLSFQGVVVEENGGFVSCLSPIFDPPLNLSEYLGIKLDIDRDGRTLKFAVACKDNFLEFTEFMDWGLRWVAEFPTNQSGTTTAVIPFNSLKPTIRAKSVPLPLKFDPSVVTQFQLLHSKFGLSGKLNTGFRPGPIKILLRSICGVR